MYVKPIKMLDGRAAGKRVLIHSSDASRWPMVVRAVVRAAGCRCWQVAGPGRILAPGELYSDGHL